MVLLRNELWVGTGRLLATPSDCEQKFDLGWDENRAMKVWDNP